MTATVAELTEWIESQFPVGEPTTSWKSVTGEPYVVIAIGGHFQDIAGVIEEGNPREIGFDEKAACWSARSAFSQYAEGKTGTLYWRVKPELERWRDSSRFAVYMRLLISDKPRIA